MAVLSRITKVTVNLKLNNGTSASGGVKTLNVSFGSLNKDTYDAQKVINIVALLAPMFTKSVYRTQKTEVSELEEE